MIFERPVVAIAAPLVGIACAVLALVARRRRVASASAWSRALGEYARKLGRYSPLILGVVAATATLGIAGPRWGLVTGTAESRALNIVVVVDVSRSMLAEDVAPNRLGRAVSLARRLVQDLDGDRFALVGFAGHAYLLSPLTLDQSAITLQLDALDPEMASVGGSGIAPALELARKTLTASPQGGDRAVILLSDGESFDPPGELESAARALKRSGVTLVAIPVGDVRGIRIPEGDGSWHHDAQGREVITTRRDDLLQVATRAASGVFIAANAPDPVGDARRALSHLTRVAANDRTAADLAPRAWILALLAALLLIGHTMTRRSASLVALVLMFGAHAASAQRPSTGNRLLSRGDTVRARQAFADDAKTHQSDTAWYNAGTSALIAGDGAAAIDALERASFSFDPALRQRALYNLGTAYLLQARRDTARRDSLLGSASARLQEALLLAPRDRNAKFNYELARRLRPPPPPPKSGKSNGKGGANQPPPRATPSGRGGMTPAEADQVLSAMERAERDTRQAQYQRARRGDASGGPDW